MASKSVPRPVVLIVLDGFGSAPAGRGNCIAHAKKPNYDSYWKNYPHTQLRASGMDVGLPPGTQGNSEVGHLHIGAGQIVWQPLQLINNHIEEGTFFKNSALLRAVEHVKKYDSQLHLMGLCSDAGVHATMNHLYALLKLAQKHNLSKVYLHCFLDGRDVGEKTASKYLMQLQEKMKKFGVGTIASLVGRYYAMDRDKNWSRTQQAYSLLVDGHGEKAEDPLQALEFAYGQGAQTDYYVQPIVIVDGQQKPVATIRHHDAVIFFNFRSDRPRQLTQAFVDKTFSHFSTKNFKNLFFVTMTEYDPHFKIPVAFAQTPVKNNLGKVLSTHNLKQLKIAETEKYAHVTYFFNSQVEEPFSGEDRILVPSAKLPSYDHKPEMSAQEITQKALETIQKNSYDFILINYANCDLVGHSGKIFAVTKAVEVVDACLGKVVPAICAQHGVVIITADHGNAEEMLYKDGSAKPSHTTNPVPFIIISDEVLFKSLKLRKEGGLIDVTPTILELMQLPKPKEMKGKSLIISNRARI